MSSPFRHFRKHSKVFMATAAVLCMFIFVFASGGGGGGAPQPGGREATATVATWKGGRLNQQELSSLVQQRLIVDDFLRRLLSQAGVQSDYDLPSSVPILLLGSRDADQIEMEVVAAEVLSSLAKQASLSVSDQMINHYLAEFSLKRVSRDEMVGILSSLNAQGNPTQNETIIFNTLRKMLLSYFYRQSFADASFVVLPEERWNDWRRVNERIALQVASLPVEDFIKDVPEPTDAQLLTFFNSYKDFEPDRLFNVDGQELSGPDPGFAEPRRVQLAFVKGGVTERTAQYLDKVTDAEIADYYERNKRLDFVKSDFDPAAEDEAAMDAVADDQEEADAASPPADVDQPADPAADAPPADDAEAAPATDDSAPAEPAAPADAVAPAENESAAPAESQPSPPPAVEQPPAAEPSSSVRRRSPFRLVALQAEPAQDAPPADSDANPPASAEPAADADGDADGTPVDDAAAAAETETAPAAPATSPADPAASLIDPAAANPDNTAEIPDELEYEPLEKVRDEIRETLARDKAVQELQSLMSKATAQLQLEYNTYKSNAIRAEEAKRTPPKPSEKLTDLKWLAEKNGLVLGSTPAQTARQLRDTPLGAAADTQSGRTNVTRAAFVTLDSFEPFLAKELEGDWYLVVKTNDDPLRVPKLDEIRDRVVEAWKRREAAVLAGNRAKELATEAEKSAEPFDQFFTSKGFQVIPSTQLFSWRFYPAGQAGMGNPPILSQVPELSNVGPEFMQAAFSLTGNDTVGVMNFDKSVAYVIRLASRQYPPEELQRMFLEEDNAWPGRFDMRNARQRRFTMEVEKDILENRAGLKFDDDWLKLRAERERGN